MTDAYDNTLGTVGDGFVTYTSDKINQHGKSIAVIETQITHINQNIDDIKGDVKDTNTKIGQIQRTMDKTIFVRQIVITGIKWLGGGGAIVYVSNAVGLLTWLQNILGKML